MALLKLDALLARLGWRLLRWGRAGNGRAIGVLSIWMVWEAFAERWWRAQPVQPGAIIRYHRTRHRGPPVTLLDGTTIRRGALLIEIHLDNRQALAMAMAGATHWQRRAQALADLHALARLASSGPLGPPAALHCVTILAGIPRMLGFELRPVPRSRYWALFRFYMIGLEAVYHPMGLARLERQEERWPVECWLSVAALQARYGSDRIS